ncbi:MULTISPECIES: helix-turn-helix transcriptional regulator [Xanthomonas]|uniref:helix-turn-helix transcriptional regulator n=1 Tax=Xanthomonas TaxID=338 RepID=UPI0011AB6980|nr:MULTISPECIES: helix-turn-helix domain-containing protein [Xanthomonas]ATS39473.2 hypothetical protein XcfCFBP6988P_16185 [Xanthomonas citri pv. phaseoli var. fuscans]ATS41720.2 hypothetical protein XcfCFBP6989P_04310 [Xanthomonas citri pv. phaseoli var. fuscans]ATS47476.2 hypothetical protein XcfCFBP6990P_13055 [Xanthomonas citri pv. phaseoli var. fuscans]ATS86145.2 hypothetical protein XcfCFBP6991P_21180 [Xanthomonas citri pv. phaseoli var. fuscans]UZA98218.1 hypothetical protein OM946_136
MHVVNCTLCAWEAGVQPEPEHAHSLPVSVESIRQSLEARGCYVTVDGRVNEDTAAQLIPCSTSCLRRWRAEGKGPRCYRPAKTPWYYLADVLAWIESGDPLL